jgi:hypothetical protein
MLTAQQKTNLSPTSFLHGNFFSYVALKKKNAIDFKKKKNQNLKSKTCRFSFFLPKSSLNLIVPPKISISHLLVPLSDSLIKRLINLFLRFSKKKKKKKKIKSLQFRSLPEWAKISLSTQPHGSRRRPLSLSLSVIIFPPLFFFK